MIKKRSILMIIATFFAIVFAMSVLAIFPVKKANAESISFYDEKAAPIFYGATKITISKDAVDTFSVKDSRFSQAAACFSVTRPCEIKSL